MFSMVSSSTDSNISPAAMPKTPNVAASVAKTGMLTMPSFCVFETIKVRSDQLSRVEFCFIANHYAQPGVPVFDFGLPAKASLQPSTLADFLAEPPSICSISVNLSSTTTPLWLISNSLMLGSIADPRALNITRARLSALCDSTCLKDRITSARDDTQKSEGRAPSLVRAVARQVIPVDLPRVVRRLITWKNSSSYITLSRLVRPSTINLEGRYSSIILLVSENTRWMLPGSGK